MRGCPAGAVLAVVQWKSSGCCVGAASSRTNSRYEAIALSSRTMSR
jgi:hypothetical protein